MSRDRTARLVATVWICAFGSCATPPHAGKPQPSKAAPSTQTSRAETVTQDRETARSRRIGHLDPTQSFFHPAFTKKPDAQLARTNAGPITAETYIRYLTGRLGTRYLEDLAFDLALARECVARKIARSARVLARSTAAQRFYESGRGRQTDPDGSLRIKFLNEALRNLRVDALVRDERKRDERAIANLFDRRYGVGGERAHIRHVLVSFRATERRLDASGKTVDEASVRAAALERAKKLHSALGTGKEFADLLRESDDRVTKALLRDGHVDRAGLLPGYNYQRYGQQFAETVRRLKEGEISNPVPSSVGVHLVQLIRREVTRLADVRPRLIRELGMGQAKPSEIQRLRTKLLAKYGYKPLELARLP